MNDRDPTMEDLFGADSDHEAMEDAVPGVKGLFLIKRFLSEEEQDKLAEAIESTYHFEGDTVSNQALSA